MEALFSGGPGLSPGPMTLVSNFFSKYYPESNNCSFSQLLAGAMASSMAKPNQFSGKDLKSEDGSEKKSGFKQNRPMNLVVAQSPLFMMPPGLSPSRFLNSPGFFSPLQLPGSASKNFNVSSCHCRCAATGTNDSFMAPHPMMQPGGFYMQQPQAAAVPQQQPVFTAKGPLLFNTPQTMQDLQQQKMLQHHAQGGLLGPNTPLFILACLFYSILLLIAYTKTVV